MQPVKEKLRNLRKILPHEEEPLYAFARAMAERLNSTVTPQGFYLLGSVMVQEAYQGVRGRETEPLLADLQGYEREFYANLQAAIVPLANVTCDKHFAIEVAQHHAKVMEMARAESKKILDG